jgi:hypothetical protein
MKAFRIIYLTIFFFCLAGLAACLKSGKQIVGVDPAFGRYISGYTSGMISRKATIRIQLADTSIASGSSLLAPSKEKPEDLIEFEPTKTMSSFVIGFNAYGSNPYLTFWHKYNTDSLKDGGYIEFSGNNGLHWTGDDSTLNYLGVYCINPSNEPKSHLYTGKLGYAGTQTAWVMETILFRCCAMVSNKNALPGLSSNTNSLVRFTFVSDSIETNKEGWMIDDISFANDNGLCTDVKELHMYALQPTHIFPNPASREATLTVTSAMEIRDGVLVISDLLGREVKRYSGINARDYYFSLDGLDKGSYSYSFFIKSDLIGTGKITLE